MSIHHVKLVHGSRANGSDQRRIGLAIRFVPPYVRQITGQLDRATLVRGVDTYGHFAPERQPLADLEREAVRFHAAALEEIGKVIYR